MPGEDNRTVKELLKAAHEAELSNSTKEAIILYKEAISADKLNEYAWNRLMILFRKEKDFKKELVTINQAIKVFESFYSSKKTKSKTIASISEKLSRSVGLADKKGNSLYSPEPIATWTKRKHVVEKKV